MFTVTNIWAGPIVHISQWVKEWRLQIGAPGYNIQFTPITLSKDIKHIEN
jgi:hypothetical protein